MWPKRTRINAYTERSRGSITYLRTLRHYTHPTSTRTTNPSNPATVTRRIARATASQVCGVRIQPTGSPRVPVYSCVITATSIISSKGDIRCILRRYSATTYIYAAKSSTVLPSGVDSGAISDTSTGNSATATVT
jgi:hypothetical protein